MRARRFLLTRIIPYWGQNLRFWKIRKNTSQWKPVFLHILCSAKIQQKQEKTTRANTLGKQLWFRINSNYFDILNAFQKVSHTKKLRPDFLNFLKVIVHMVLTKLYFLNKVLGNTSSIVLICHIFLPLFCLLKNVALRIRKNIHPIQKQLVADVLQNRNLQLY